MFETPEQFQSWVDNYFDAIAELKTRPTITGLCYHLGFESRQSFYDYEDREGFSYVTKRARLRIETIYEEALFSRTAQVGAIFALKNFGWTDKQEIKHEGIPDSNIQVTIAKGDE